MTEQEMKERMRRAEKALARERAKREMELTLRMLELKRMHPIRKARAEA